MTQLAKIGERGRGGIALKPPLLSDRVELLALHARDSMVEWVCQPHIQQQTQSALEARLRMGTRDGVNNVLRLMGLLAPESTTVQIAIGQMLVGLGVQNEQELTELVTAGKAMQQLKQDATSSFEDWKHEALEVLKTVLAHHPEWRGEILEALGGKVVGMNGTGR